MNGTKIVLVNDKNILVCTYIQAPIGGIIRLYALVYARMFVHACWRIKLEEKIGKIISLIG